MPRVDLQEWNTHLHLRQPSGDGRPARTLCTRSLARPSVWAACRRRRARDSDSGRVQTKRAFIHRAEDASGAQQAVAAAAHGLDLPLFHDSPPLWTNLIPKSFTTILSKYDVPALIHPQIKAFTSVRSKLNSSVYGLMPHRNTPTQNPMHKWQWNKRPKPPIDLQAGRILLKMCPCIIINVMP